MQHSHGRQVTRLGSYMHVVEVVEFVLQEDTVSNQTYTAIWLELVRTIQADQNATLSCFLS